MIKCLILEDEIAAQEVLQSYIDKTPFLDCVGIYESGLDLTQEQLQRADILFLDVQLPEINGLSYLKTITNPPKVIVTTAYSNYAIDAFEEAVIDYLLKPFPFERFFKAIIRAKNQLQVEHKGADESLFLYADKTFYKINIDDILYLSAEVDYVKVVTEEKSILILDSLRNWEEKLQNFRFIQVHRSYIVNLEKITKVYENLVFISDNAIPIGKTYKELFMKEIKN